MIMLTNPKSGIHLTSNGLQTVCNPFFILNHSKANGLSYFINHVVKLTCHENCQDI